MNIIELFKEFSDFLNKVSLEECRKFNTNPYRWINENLGPNWKTILKDKGFTIDNVD